MRAVLAGGGTGGHVIPAIAIANQLRDAHGAEIIFIGTARGMETRLVPKAGYKLELVQIGALNQVSMATKLTTLARLPFSVLDARRILKRFNADVIVSVGGYASGPAALAAKLTGIPLLLFEPNLVPGFANRIAARFASGSAVMFEETCRALPNCRVTGVPVRQAFFAIPPRPSGAPPTLLVFGGSQGARAINRNVVAALPLLKASMPELRIVHQTGERDYNDAREQYERAGIAAEVSPFIDDMPGAFSRADLLLCRSGASTVAEVTAAGKPAIFVPLPTAADDHQRHNALALEKRDAAVLLPEAELTPERLASTVTDLLRHRDRLARMGEAAKTLAHPNAGAEIAGMALQLMKH